MTEAEWLACEEARLMLDCLKGRGSERKWRLFAVACAWQLEPWFPDPVLKDALLRAQLFGDGALACRTLDTWRQKAMRIERPLPKYAAVLMPPVRACEAVISACRHPPTIGYFDAYHALVFPFSAFGPGFEAFAPVFVRNILRCIFGAAFHPVPRDPIWTLGTVASLATAT
jgi:hypothetical protein